MISPKQQRVFNFIVNYITSNKEAPTITEIGRFFQMRSTASVHQLLGILEREGLIKRTPNIGRGIEIVREK